MEKPGNIDLLSFIIKDDRENIKRCIAGNNFNFNDFNDFVKSNKLSGYLYVALQSCLLNDLFPPDLIKSFKPSYIKQWSNNEKLLREIRALRSLFTDSGREVIFLKGPFLAQHFYGNIDRRSIGDIDVLVKAEEDFNMLDKLLTGEGYRRNSIILFNEKLARYFTHHFEYKKKNVILELHWELQRHFSININYDRLWMQKEEFIYNSSIYHVLSDEYSLVAFLCSIFMDIQTGKLAYKTLLDVYMVLKSIDKDTQWEPFFASRKEEGLFLISLNMLDLVLSFFDCYDDFKELSLYVEKNTRFLKCRGLLDRLIKKRMLSNIRNKMLLLRLYDAPLILSYFWWLISLPFRVLVYWEANPKPLRKIADYLFDFPRRNFRDS